MEIISDNSGRRYKVVNGTSYYIETPDFMVELLERLRHNNTRVRFYFGDMKTGEDWGEINDIFGTIGRSGGSIKIPLLIHNARSSGGGGLLTDSIVMIRHANKQDGGVIWKHPTYYRKMN